MNYHNIVEVWRVGANYKGRGRSTELEHTIIYLTRTLHTHLNKTEYLRTLSDIIIHNITKITRICNTLVLPHLAPQVQLWQRAASGKGK